MNDIAILAVVVAVYMSVAIWLKLRWISLPIAFVAAGFLLGPDVLDVIINPFSVELSKEFTEVTLGLLLFADASTLAARRVAQERSLETRLLGIGLPLTIGLGALLAFIVYPDEPIGLILLIGAALAPTDAALGLPIFTDPKLPSRIRLSLNVESGLNDGIATPFVTLFIALAVSETAGHEGGWLSGAIEEIAIALVVGVVVGVVGGWLVASALRRGWTSMESAKVAFLALGLVAFFGARGFEGNGFIAAFAGGLACSIMLADVATETAEYTEITGTTMSYIVWMLFGVGLVPLALGDLFSWRAVIFSILAITVMRMLPVALAMIGLGLRRDTSAIIGWFGPRGLASVVFLIMALVEFEHNGTPTDVLVSAMTWTILLSVILHGLTATPFAAWYANRLKTAPRSIPEFLHDAPNQSDAT